jgi:endonuclease/exonuclease/phosphatase family metal-dependent hydrolase
MKLRLLLFICFVQMCVALPVMAARNKTTYFSANILYCDIEYGEKRSDYVRRREDLIALLAKLKPDVIGVQEASVCKIYGHPSGDDTMKEVVLGLKKRGLNYGSSFWLSESVGALWVEGLAFLWNKDTVALGKEHISCRHLDASYLRKGALIQKSLCRADVSAMDGGPPLSIYNTHLESYEDDVRGKQSLEVSEILRNETAVSKRRALFGGDMNSEDMKNIFEAAGFQLISLNRVDYIFSHGISSGDISAEVIPLHSIPGKPDISDHNGILVTVWDE